MHRYLCTVKTFIHVNKNLKMKWRVIEEDTQYDLWPPHTHVYTHVYKHSHANIHAYTQRITKELFCVDSKQSSAVPQDSPIHCQVFLTAHYMTKISHSVAIFYIQWLVTLWHEMWVLGDGRSIHPSSPKYPCTFTSLAQPSHPCLKSHPWLQEAFTIFSKLLLPSLIGTGL